MNLPIALTYSAILKPGDKVRPIQMEESKNPYPSHIWLDEISFYVAPGNAEKLTGKAVKMRFKLDNAYVVEDFTPLTLLAPRTDVTEDLTTNDVFVSGLPKPNLSITWKFPKPLWISKNENLLFELFLDNNEIATAGGSLTQLANVQVCVKGRATDEVPNERYRPFVVHWRPPIFLNDTSMVSGDENLKNSRAQTVHVTRLLSDFGTANTIESTLFSDFAFGTIWMNILLSHSAGYYIVKQPTPLYELFSGNRRNFDIRMELKPLEFLTVQIDTKKQAVPLGSPTVPFNWSYYGGISVQGFSIEKVTMPH